MEVFTRSLLILHIAAGAVALFVAPVAMIVKKGGRNHAIWGLTFFWCMTIIFVTALYLSTVKWIPFLLMIAVFSYYAVLSGYRWKFLKGIHNKSQRVTMLDWAALGTNAVFNLVFIGWGIYVLVQGYGGAFPYLALGFGTLGVRSSYNNFKLFTHTHHPKTWLFQHIGGMVGGFIATVTAFSAQVISFMPIWLRWSWPSIIGVPLIIYWIGIYRKKYKTSAL
ncbi:MAG: hypothetical protein AAF519_16435 [Bacteroidota bacterium]